MGEEKKNKRPKSDENPEDSKTNKQKLKAEKKADKKEEANFKKLPNQEKIDFLQEKIKTMKADRIIELAKLDNSRKQYEKDFVDRQKYAVGSFAKDLLPALDTFSMALSSKNVSDEIKNWLRGFEMVKGMFDQSFELNGIKEIEVNIGDPFNSKYHHAVEHKVVTDMKHDTILKVSQSGYMIGDRLLRPATVTVVNNKNVNANSSAEGNQSVNPSTQVNSNNGNVAPSNQPNSNSSNNAQQPMNNANASRSTQQQVNNANASQSTQQNVNSQQQMNNANASRSVQQSVSSQQQMNNANASRNVQQVNNANRQQNSQAVNNQNSQNVQNNSNSSRQGNFANNRPNLNNSRSQNNTNQNNTNQNNTNQNNTNQNNK